jgi:hypothetical protein
VTAVPNFFLASDYVRTYTDLATMEGANEAARRATNGILAASGSDAEPCGVWKLHEPEVLLPLREYDRQRFDAHLPWDGRFVALGQHALGVAGAAAALVGGGAPVEGEGGGRALELARRLQRDAAELAALYLPTTPPTVTAIPVDAAVRDALVAPLVRIVSE